MNSMHHPLYTLQKIVSGCHPTAVAQVALAIYANNIMPTSKTTSNNDIKPTSTLHPTSKTPHSSPAQTVGPPAALEQA